MSTDASLKHPPARGLSAILQADGLQFRYPQRDLFTHLSASIAPGVTLVRGGDGCGKTTLLRLLAGELAAHAGQLNIKGTGLQKQAQAYRQQVFWTEPRTDAFDQMTPSGYFESQRKRFAGFEEAMLAHCVDGLSLAPEMNKQLYMLSTGSKRKVWLAAAFASGAAVTLLDMPFAALDKASISFVLGLLQKAADHPDRACVLADYTAPDGVRLAGVIDLGD
ncbi:ATP-binding cassette domain-containing protein [Polaromonas sp.]|uniref:ABC transporter ATP-binding protein n=1 Tax=Polaromonas sp. TaxID=1869339 RepID=UPI0032659492